MPDNFSHQRSKPSSSSRARLIAPAVLLIGALGASGWWATESLLVNQAVQESRTMADLADNVGRWASQYGGVHARTVGVDAKYPGVFLTRATFAGSEADDTLIRGIKLGGTANVTAAGQRVENYYWKNPALVQREVGDVIAASGARSRYRLTARTVMNRTNTPNAFEIEALNALQGAPEKSEYWQVKGGQMLYARAVVAQKSCMACHTSLAKAPEFIRTNATFNGGGGFGYMEGKPSALISVTVPVMSARRALATSGSPYM